MLTNAILRCDETTSRIKEATLTRTKTDRIVKVIMMMTVENGEIGTTMVEVNDEITMIDDGRSRILQPPVEIVNKDADPDDALRRKDKGKTGEEKKTMNKEAPESSKKRSRKSGKRKATKEVLEHIPN
uniref:Uncharacterized protein n=1 Tax=Oryza glaberrima TaxID=4538 RepID=I1NZZ6_ORYGL